MPKKTIEIAQFDGMLGVVDEKDLPPGSAAYAKNIDMVVESGAFVSLPDDKDIGGSDPTNATFLAPVEDASSHVFGDGTTIKSIVLSTGSVATVGTASAGAASCAVSDGDAVHIGMGASATADPQWVGNIYHGQFGNAAPSGLQMESALLKNDSVYFSSTPVFSGATSESEVTFELGRKYFWYVSLVYDNLQESPLALLGSVSSPVATGDYGARDMYVFARVVTEGTVGGKTPISKRVAFLKFYRAYAIGDDADTPTSEIYHFQTVSLQDATFADRYWSWSWQETTDGETTYYDLPLRDSGFSDSVFENAAGYSSTLEHMDIRYGLSVTSDGYHIVGDIHHADLKAMPNMLMRSKAHRFDTFDWSSDYLRLPTTPTALAAFQGRVYAFSSGRTYVVNVETFSIEQELDGIGCYGPNAVAVTDRGMFWCDPRNIYHHDGTRIQPIGRAVMRNQVVSAAGWESNTDTAPLVVYDPRYDSVVVWYRVDTATHGLMYHVASGRWQAIDPPVATGAFGTTAHDSLGRTYYMVGNDLYELFGGAGTRAWEWVSPDLARPGNLTKFYHAALSHRGAADPPDVYFWENGKYADTPTGPVSAVASEGNVSRFKVNDGTWNAARSFMLKLSDQGSDTATHVSVINREVSAR